MLLACFRRSDRGEHAVLHYPNAWTAKMLSASYKTDRGHLLLLMGGGGGAGAGRGTEKLNVQFYLRTPTPPPATFYFARPPLTIH